MSAVFNTKWARKRSEGEINLGPSHVDMSGYIPPKQQIENMIESGISLADYRRGLYFPETDSDDVTPVYADKLSATEHYKALSEKGRKIDQENRTNKEKAAEELKNARIISEYEAKKALEKESANSVLPDNPPV